MDNILIAANGVVDVEQFGEILYRAIGSGTYRLMSEGVVEEQEAPLGVIKIAPQLRLRVVGICSRSKAIGECVGHRHQIILIAARNGEQEGG